MLKDLTALINSLTKLSLRIEELLKLVDQLIEAGPMIIEMVNQVFV